MGYEKWRQVILLVKITIILLPLMFLSEFCPLIKLIYYY